jgi:hypothetical protein
VSKQLSDCNTSFIKMIDAARAFFKGILGDSAQSRNYLMFGINSLKCSKNLSEITEGDFKISDKLFNSLDSVASGCEWLIKCGDSGIGKEAKVLLKMDIGENTSLGDWSRRAYSKRATLGYAWSSQPDKGLTKIHLLGPKVVALIKRAEDLQLLVAPMPAYRRVRSLPPRTTFKQALGSCSSRAGLPQRAGFGSNLGAEPKSGWFERSVNRVRSLRYTRKLQKDDCL